MKRIHKRQAPVIAVGILLACCSCTFALNPSLDVNQYAHTAWKSGEALPAAVIRMIAQTPDGYLWLATEFEVFRFDGVRAVPWKPPDGEHLPTDDIRSLHGARDGIELSVPGTVAYGAQVQRSWFSKVFSWTTKKESTEL